MKLALQPARRNPHAKRAPPNLSISARRSGAKLCAINPFRINTCESVSKQRTLTTFRMNTYEKRGEGGVSTPGYGPGTSLTEWTGSIPYTAELWQLRVKQAHVLANE